jgi:hypothetical protein
MQAVAAKLSGTTNKRAKMDLAKVQGSTVPDSGSPTKERRLATSALSNEQSESISVE